jgi:hypothetical protein
VVASESTPLEVMVEQQVALRNELNRSPQELSPRQVGIIRKAQTEFFRLVEGKTSMDQLAIEDKVRLENALETINAQIVNTNVGFGNQEVCWREPVTGSNTKVTRCGTKDEIDQARQSARDVLEKPRACAPNCN